MNVYFIVLMETAVNLIFGGIFSKRLAQDMSECLVYSSSQWVQHTFGVDSNPEFVTEKKPRDKLFPSVS